MGGMLLEDEREKSLFLIHAGTDIFLARRHAPIYLFLEIYIYMTDL